MEKEIILEKNDILIVKQEKQECKHNWMPYKYITTTELWNDDAKTIPEKQEIKVEFVYCSKCLEKKYLNPDPADTGI